MYGINYTGDDSLDTEAELRLAAEAGNGCRDCLASTHLTPDCPLRFACPRCATDSHEYEANGGGEVAEWYGIQPDHCRVAAQASIARSRGSYDYMRLTGSNPDVYGHYGDVGETDPEYARYLAQR